MGSATLANNKGMASLKILSSRGINKYGEESIGRTPPRGFQRRHFSRQRPVLPGSTSSFSGPELHPFDLLYIEPDLFKHPPDLPVAPFNQITSYHGFGVFSDQPNLAVRSFHSFGQSSSGIESPRAAAQYLSRSAVR